MRKLDCEDFLKAQGVLIDVRSPKEFLHAKIPGALNIPLLDDEERALIGTLYKKSGKALAIEEGFGLVGPKLKNFIQTAKHLLQGKPAKLYCARGGLRSSSFAFILETASIDTILLENGYKAFRHFCLTQDFSSLHFTVVSGFTGCGKTNFLQNQRENKSQVIDLENLAKHRGSSYGIIPGIEQISTEQFENEIACQLLQFDPSIPILIEDESRMIGKCRIPDALFQKMGLSPRLLIEKPFAERVDRLLTEYGCLEKEILIAATNRIAKRLGSLRTKEVICHIEAGFLRKAIEIVLKYYDSAYLGEIKKEQNKSNN